MQPRIMRALLAMSALCLACWLVGRIPFTSSLTRVGRAAANDGELRGDAPLLQPVTADSPGITWVVENRCRAIYLPAILKGSTGAFRVSLPVRRAGLNCLQISDADLAQIKWDAQVEIYGRQANRNRQAFDLVPLGTWGR